MRDSIVALLQDVRSVVSWRRIGVAEPIPEPAPVRGDRGDRQRRSMTSMTDSTPGGADQRDAERRDRRRVPRGGRREGDRPGRYPTVLVVDGDEPARRPCVRYLEYFGFQVQEASTGAEAQALIDQARPHAIVAEVPMQGVPRATRFDPGAIPFIEMRTFMDPEDVAGGRALASSAVLLKPFSLASMLHEIRKVLRRRSKPSDRRLDA